MRTVKELDHYPDAVCELYSVGRSGFKTLTMEYALSMIMRCFNALLFEVDPNKRGKRDLAMLDKFISLIAGAKDSMEDRSERDFIYNLGEDIFMCHIEISCLQISSHNYLLY